MWKEWARLGIAAKTEGFREFPKNKKLGRLGRKEWKKKKKKKPRPLGELEALWFPTGD